MTVKVGDKIRITDTHWASIDKYKEGDVFTVLKVDSDGDVRIYLSPEDAYYLVVKSEFEVLSEDSSANNTKIAELESRIAALEAAQPSAQQAPEMPEYRKVTDRSPQVGDYVKYDEAPTSYFTDGKYYEITRIDSCGDPHINDDDGDDFDTNDDGGFEVYEKVDEPRAQQAQSLKVGDKVRLLSGGGAYLLHGFNDGDICEVIQDIDNDGELRIESENSKGYAKPDQLEKLPDEEAQQLEADRAIAAKFAEIGRKPGEFKAGDIVKVRYTAGGHPIGTIGELVSGSIFLTPREFGVEANGKTYDHGGPTLKDNVELITPVERRFDR